MKILIEMSPYLTPDPTIYINNVHSCRFVKRLHTTHSREKFDDYMPASHGGTFINTQVLIVNSNVSSDLTCKFQMQVRKYRFFNPIIPGVQKPYSARGGASEAPRVKSQHSGLPDDPMPYNGNYILCLGIN